MNLQTVVVQVTSLPDLFKHLQKMKDFSFLVSLCSPCPATQEHVSSFSLFSVTEYLYHLTSPFRISRSLINTKALGSHNISSKQKCERTVKKQVAGKICTSWSSDIPNVSATFCFPLFKRRWLSPTQPLVNRKMTIWMREGPPALLGQPNRWPLSDAFPYPHS